MILESIRVFVVIFLDSCCCMGRHRRWYQHLQWAYLWMRYAQEAHREARAAGLRVKPLWSDVWGDDDTEVKP